METIKEKRPEEKEEKKIPVFTVLKNGAILKNIFVINKPPSPSSMVSAGSGSESITSVKNAENPDQETEEILVVGRHPDCNIVLMHPSISRFHLQINSKTSSQRLFVTDLSSVHGTWVSGKKIEAGIRVELHDGDTIRVGGSTRLYKLHWVPLSSAYDMENPFVLPSDVSMIEEIEEEYELLEEGNETKTCQVENLLPAGSKNVNEKDVAIVEIDSANICQSNVLMASEVKPVEESVQLEVAGTEQRAYHEMNSIENGEIQDLKSVLDGIIPLFSDENCGFTAKGDVPMASLMPENKNSSLSDDKEETEGQSGNDNELREILNPIITKEDSFIAKTQQFDEHSNLPVYHFAKEATLENGSTESSLRSEKESNCLVNLDSSLSIAKLEVPPAIDVAEQTINQGLIGTPNEQLIVHPLVTENVNSSLPVGDDVLETSKKINEEDQTQDPHYALQPLYEEGKRWNSTPHHATPQFLEEIENQILSEKCNHQTEFTNVCSLLLAAESGNSSFPVEVVLSEIVENKEAQKPQSMFAATENKDNSNDNLEDSQSSSEKELRSGNIWSTRGKPAAALHLQTSTGKDKGFAEVEGENREDGDNKLTTMALYSASEVMEESSSPEKENYRPNSLLQKSLRRKGMPDEIQTPESCRRSSSNVVSSPSIHLENVIVLSDKENQSPKCLKERKSTIQNSNCQRKSDQDTVLRKRIAERLPLQCLLTNSLEMSISEVPMRSAATSSISVQHQNPTSIKSVLEGKRRWIMVADISSLLDKKSRTSLQLLQGLKRTQLVIPRMVIRELDCLKRRGSLFRRTLEASLALEWIEECLSKTKWWIHVQSSVDDGRLIAPTPPASPQSEFSQGSGGFPCGTKSSAPFSAHVSSLEIASPTAEDHILDYALSYRKMNYNGQLVLISNDVTLKIKAMAEGLGCEKATEFRDSLVNPFSERFLWADSSPRGQTWSVLDDVVLKERYYPSPSKKSSKGEAAEGLKLILLHNFHYGQISDTIDRV